jgi:hypothetical protein
MDSEPFPRRKKLCSSLVVSQESKFVHNNAAFHTSTFLVVTGVQFWVPAAQGTRECRGQSRYGAGAVANAGSSMVDTSEGQHVQHVPRVNRLHDRIKRQQNSKNTEAARKQHQNEPRDESCVWMPQEDEEGNVEYKLRLKDPSTARLEQLVRFCSLGQHASGGAHIHITAAQFASSPQQSLVCQHCFLGIRASTSRLVPLNVRPSYKCSLIHPS